MLEKSREGKRAFLVWEKLFIYIVLYEPETTANNDSEECAEKFVLSLIYLNIEGISTCLKTF
jgi:vesicle coat complex subunit